MGHAKETTHTKATNGWNKRLLGDDWTPNLILALVGVGAFTRDEICAERGGRGGGCRKTKSRVQWRGSGGRATRVQKGVALLFWAPHLVSRLLLRHTDEEKRKLNTTRCRRGVGQATHLSASAPEASDISPRRRGAPPWRFTRRTLQREHRGARPFLSFTRQNRELAVLADDETVEVPEES